MMFVVKHLCERVEVGCTITLSLISASWLSIKRALPVVVPALEASEALIAFKAAEVEPGVGGVGVWGRAALELPGATPCARVLDAHLVAAGICSITGGLIKLTLVLTLARLGRVALAWDADLSGGA